MALKKLERRIKALVKNRPGIKSSQIIEYLGMDPEKVMTTLQDMKQRGAVVGTPVKGEYLGIADTMEVEE